MFKKFLRYSFANQTGAMFGMDARIALIVASVMAGTLGITIMSRMDRSKVDATERNLVIMRDAILDYYANISITSFPESLEDLFSEGLITDASAKLDPWQNHWSYSYAIETITLENTEIEMKYAVIFSPGKDGIEDSAIIVTEQDYAMWEEKNDDKGIKISSRDVELARLEEFRARGQLIVDKLQDAESIAYLEATGSCDGITPPTWCTDYEGKNNTQFNFYPKSDLDTIEEAIYLTDARGEGQIYSAGDINDMQQLVKNIGLPPTYATDPWGRVLFYHSNITDRADPPFSASICFSNGSNCF